MADPTKIANHVAAPAQAFKIESIDDDPFEYINMLVYGAPGSGKTTLCGTAADVDAMADVLMIDIEAGKMTIKNNDRIKRKDRVDTIRVTSYKQLSDVHTFLQAHCRYRDLEGAEDKLIALEARFRGTTPDKITKPRKYRTVIIDSMSELDALCIYELLGLSTDMKLSEAMADGEMETATFAEYKKNNQIMQLVTRAYRDLPINVLLTCHTAYAQDELKRMFYMPSLTGKLRNQIQGFVDIVGYLRVGELQEGQKKAPRRLMVQPVGKFDAKCRLAAFKESYFEDPTMSSIWKELGV